MARRALLLGIDAYKESALQLSAAAHDVNDLEMTLTLVGFLQDQITSLVASADNLLTTSTLRREIRKFFQEADQNDELLMYFSGHGVEWEGHRLLIPQDYYTDDPRPRHELISDHDLYAWARNSTAASVLIIIDACREGIRLEIAADPATEKSVASIQGQESFREPIPQAPTIAMLYSCGQGEYSYADATYSYFTKALCQVLKIEHQYVILGEIIEATQRRLTEILPAGKRQTVTLDERRITGRAGTPEKLIVKEDIATRFRSQLENSSWCRIAQANDLWPLIQRLSADFTDQVRAIIFRTEQLVSEASSKLPQQRWRDPMMPMRIVHRFEQLIQQTRDDVLTPPEAAIAFLVPYIYEAVLAAAELRLIAEGNPLEPLATEERATASRMWRALRNNFLAEETWARRRHLLVQRGNDEAAVDIAAWQLNRFLHESGELWDYTPGMPAGAKGWINPALDALFEPAPLSGIKEDHRVLAVLNGKRLIRLARLMFASFEDIEIERTGDHGGRLDPAFRVGDYPHEWHLDEVKLAHLLALAGAMGPDPRRLAAVIAEHIGIAPEMTLDRLMNVLAKTEWRRDSEGLVLGLNCPHEAIDAALEELVQSLDQHRRQMDTAGIVGVPFLNALPAHFSDREVRPTEDQGQPRFRRPHLRFSLNQNRVRDLLMGQALYGEPTLALRELYQNALDACRYRRARDQYLHKTGKLSRDVQIYQGRITFMAGIDHGRPFIACTDNGIGMAERHLRTLFAQAGRRFADSHEFHLEKAEWEEAGVPFYPNSRFGIGVFSYFMLADEILIETRRLKPNGISYDLGVRVRIVGSGSLFRLQLADELQPQGGTLVRLYLSKQQQPEDQLINSIKKWLSLPEFETVLYHEDGGETVLQAGEPSPWELEERGPAVPIPESANKVSQPRVYWVPQEHSRILSDITLKALERLTLRTRPNRFWRHGWYEISMIIIIHIW